MTFSRKDWNLYQSETIPCSMKFPLCQNFWRQWSMNGGHGVIRVGLLEIQQWMTTRSRLDLRQTTEVVMIEEEPLPEAASSFPF
jgi:hypothetical protein